MSEYLRQQCAYLHVPISSELNLFCASFQRVALWVSRLDDLPTTSCMMLILRCLELGISFDCQLGYIEELDAQGSR
jgi:hypothetical protein